MKVVNLFAGPGAGKSTTAAGLFHRLKTDGVNCELVGEYAKDLTWAGRITELKNQIKVLGEQYHRLDRLRGKVDVAIVDSPLPLCVVYARRAMPEPEMSMLRQSVGATALHAFQTFDNLNVFLVREKPYIKVGRNQTEDEAKGLDAEIRELLEMFSIPHAVVRGSADAPQEIQKLLFSPAGLMRRGKCGTCRGTGRVGPADPRTTCTSAPTAAAPGTGDATTKRRKIMSWRTEADRMWRDPETRREFESETGFVPLAESEDELELQKADGHVDAYHRRFVEWARVRIETREMSLPDQIRHVAETCPPRKREALRGIALRFEKEYEPFGGLGCGNPDCETCV